jgi:hypothetical protein
LFSTVAVFQTIDRVERDRLLLFIHKLILHRDNAAAVVQVTILFHLFNI